MDRYEKIKVVGKGTFGSAVLVRSKEDGNKYIIKQINLATMPKSEREEAMNEVRVLRQLDHPNIVRYVDSFESDRKMLNIVMEYAEGGDLYQSIQKQKGSGFTEQQILDWFVQIALALKHVHGKRILHRDLKTQNIFLSSNNMVKMGDFGIARILKSTMECARTLVGTPYYLSPELCQEKPYNNKSDIWSLGCVLYEMATRRHAFNATSMKGLIGKILRGVYPPLPSRYSPQLRRLVDWMLQRDPRNRPSINTILRLPFIQARIDSFLSNTLQRREFGGAAAPSPSSPSPRPQPPASSRLSPPQQRPGKVDHRHDHRPNVEHQRRKALEAEREKEQRRKKAKEAEEREIRRRSRLAEEERHRRRMEELKAKQAQLLREKEDAARREAQEKENDYRRAAFLEAKAAAARNRERVEEQLYGSPLKKNNKDEAPPQHSPGINYQQEKHRNAEKIRKERQQKQEEEMAAWRRQQFFEMREAAARNRQKVEAQLYGRDLESAKSDNKTQSNNEDNNNETEEKDFNYNNDNDNNIHEKESNNDNNNNDDNIEQPIYHTDNKDNEKDKNVNGNMDPVSVGREQRLERLHQLQQRRQELQDLLTSRQHQVESKGEGNDDARQHTAMLKNMLGVLGGNGDSESEEDFSNQDRTDQESNENLIGDHDKDNDEIVENEDTNKNGERRLDKFVLDGKTLHLPHVRETDSLCYRIESLRMYLEQALGEDRMLRVYRLVEEGADSDDPRLQADLPPALVGYLSLVHQLLFCETVFNERQEENL